MSESTDTGLLNAIIDAGAAPNSKPRSTIVTDSAGVSWSIDPQTNIGTRITPVAKSALRKPTTMTRQFPPLEDPRRSDLKSQLAALAARPFEAAMLVALLALDGDRQSSLNELARTHPQITEGVRAGIVGTYLELKGGRDG